MVWGTRPALQISPHGEEARRAVSNHEGGWGLRSIAAAHAIQQMRQRLDAFIPQFRRQQPFR